MAVTRKCGYRRNYFTLKGCDVLYPIITIFGRQFGTYVLIAIAAGIPVGALFCRRIRKRGEDSEKAIVCLLFVILGMLVGGSLLYGITNIKYFPLLLKAGSFRETLMLLGQIFSGLVFYGGLFGGLCAGAIYIKVKKLPFDVYADAIAPLIPLFHGFARIGCFFGGCCYGIESQFGFIINGNDFVPGLCGVRRFPVQLLESAVCFIISAILMALYRKRPNRQGRLLPAYLCMYSVARFFIEFLRGDSYRGFVGCLSTSQVISIALFAVSLVILLKTRKQATA